MTGQRRPWMQAHPKRHDEIRFVLSVITGLVILLAATIVVPAQELAR